VGPDYIYGERLEGSAFGWSFDEKGLITIALSISFIAFVIATVVRVAIPGDNAGRRAATVTAIKVCATLFTSLCALVKFL
jgi:hypothetical protein